MRALTVQFDRGSHDYSTLLDVLINSWQRNATIPLEVIRTKAPEKKTRFYGFDANTHKLNLWAENFTEDTIFIDSDMLLLKCINNGFDLVDDVGITDRSGPIKMNGGVMFFKYTKRARQFMKDFVDVNARMMEDEEFHAHWQKEKMYAGMNQSAIGYLWETEYKDLNLLPDTFNKCEPWDDWENAQMIHIKGQLRRACIRNNRRGKENIMQIKRIWESYLPEPERTERMKRYKYA